MRFQVNACNFGLVLWIEVIALVDSAAMWTTANSCKAVAHRAWTTRIGTKGSLPTLSTVPAATAVAGRLKKITIHLHLNENNLHSKVERLLFYNYSISRQSPLRTSSFCYSARRKTLMILPILCVFKGLVSLS